MEGKDRISIFRLTSCMLWLGLGWDKRDGAVSFVEATGDGVLQSSEAGEDANEELADAKCGGCGEACEWVGWR
jgi:hypothetical protein